MDVRERLFEIESELNFCASSPSAEKRRGKAYLDSLRAESAEIQKKYYTHIRYGKPE